MFVAQVTALKDNCGREANLMSHLFGPEPHVCQPRPWKQVMRNLAGRQKRKVKKQLQSSKD